MADEFKVLIEKRSTLVEGEIYEPYVIDIESYFLENLTDETIITFIVATYGDGDPPFSAEDFWDGLKKEYIDLSNLKFVIYGLGDKSYFDYCRFAKRLKKKLENYGASCLWVGYNDAMGDRWAQWRNDQIKMLQALTGDVPDGILQLSTTPVKYKLVPSDTYIYTNIEEFATHRYKVLSKHHQSLWNVEKCEELTGELSRHDGHRTFWLRLSGDQKASKRELESQWEELTEQLKNNSGRYTLSVLPQTPQHYIDEILCLDLWDIPSDIQCDDLGSLIVDSIDNSDREGSRCAVGRQVTIPIGRTFREILTDSLDLLGAPVGSGGTVQLEKLMELVGNPSGNTGIKLNIDWDLIIQAKWNHYQFLIFLQGLSAGMGIKIDPMKWIDTVPVVDPRLYSVADIKPNKDIEIIVSEATPNYDVKDIRTTLTRFIKSMPKDVGDNLLRILNLNICHTLCSKYLISGPSKLMATLEKGDSGLPFINPSDPLILIGTGSGLAPLRRLYLTLLEREKRYTQGFVAERILIFGNRYLNDDLPLFPNEIKTLMDNGWTIYLNESRSQKVLPDEVRVVAINDGKDNIPLEYKKEFDDNNSDNIRYSICSKLILMEESYVSESVERVLNKDFPKLKETFLERDENHHGRIEICGGGKMIQDVLDSLRKIFTKEIQSDMSGIEFLTKMNRLTFEKFN